MITLNRTKDTVGDCPLVFGSARADDGLYENYAVGNVYWCKLWYADLGDAVCKELASWPHEVINMEACGFRKYYLSDNASKRCSFSMLASNLLSRDQKWTTASNNKGGWEASSLNAMLNTRLYEALPRQIRAIVKQVKVPSSIGGKSTEISTSDCYITLPAVIEVDPTMTSEPYVNEGSNISYLSTNASRKRASIGGDYRRYWLRSPNVSNDLYIYCVDDAGGMHGFIRVNQTAGVLIEMSF